MHTEKLESRIGEQVEIIGEKVLKDSYGNTIITRKGHLSEFRLGTTVFTNLPVGFFAGDIGRQKMSVMGGDLLKRFNILLDAERAFIYLKANERAGSEYSGF